MFGFAKNYVFDMADMGAARTHLRQAAERLRAHSSLLGTGTVLPWNLPSQGQYAIQRADRTREALLQFAERLTDHARTIEKRAQDMDWFGGTYWWTPADEKDASDWGWTILNTPIPGLGLAGKAAKGFKAANKGKKASSGARSTDNAGDAVRAGRGASDAGSSGARIINATTPAASGAARSVDEIETAVGQAHAARAAQSTSALAMAARSKVESGAILYRIGGEGSEHGAEMGKTLGQFWSLEHPLSPGYVARHGMPPRNIDFVETAVLRPGSRFVTRHAPGYADNPGGAVEVVVETGGVELQGFSLGTFSL